MYPYMLYAAIDTVGYNLHDLALNEVRKKVSNKDCDCNGKAKMHLQAAFACIYEMQCNPGKEAIALLPRCSRPPFPYPLILFPRSIVKVFQSRRLSDAFVRLKATIKPPIIRLTLTQHQLRHLYPRPSTCDRSSCAVPKIRMWRWYAGPI